MCGLLRASLAADEDFGEGSRAVLTHARKGDARLRSTAGEEKKISNVSGLLHVPYQITEAKNKKIQLRHNKSYKGGRRLLDTHTYTHTYTRTCIYVHVHAYI
jgi:hypothetical protein